MRVTLLALATSLLVAGPAPAADDGPRGVIELFTSQGCSSCPAADRLASELARDPRNLVLTLPVDYWDYLGWKDTLASPGNSARQRAYAMARGDRKVYTPQIVVNGREATVGSDGAAVLGAVMRAEEPENALALPVTAAVEDERLKVSVAAAVRPLATRHGEVWALSVERSRTVQIGRGENAGRSVTYANVVRRMTRLGVWDGSTAAHFEIPLEEIAHRNADGVAVLVQSGTGGQPGPILGAVAAEMAPQAAPPNQISRLPRDPL